MQIHGRQIISGILKESISAKKIRKQETEIISILQYTIKEITLEIKYYEFKKGVGIVLKSKKISSQANEKIAYQPTCLLYVPYFGRHHYKSLNVLKNVFIFECIAVTATKW